VVDLRPERVLEYHSAKTEAGHLNCKYRKNSERYKRKLIQKSRCNGSPYMNWCEDLLLVKLLYFLSLGE